MITLRNKQLCEYCLTEGSGKTCRACGFDKKTFQNDWGVLPPGSILSGKYIVGRIIGKGGFGITYLAYDINHEKQVALKEYYPISFAARGQDGVTVAASRSEDADIYTTGMEKFYEEASLVSRFNGNPNIVSVYEFFYENGTAYFVMELLKGISLKAYIDEHGTLSPEETLYIADKVSSALVVTHSINTLHRDISPDNIMLCVDGNVKLIDFGAARQVAADNPKSMSVILKQGFAPLEQYQRRGKQGPWTDIYSLGATLYYAATEDCLDDPMSRQDDDSEFQANSYDIEPQLWEVIRRSLNIRIEDRYKDTVEFRAALNEIKYEPKPLVITLHSEQTTEVVPITPLSPITAPSANGDTVSDGQVVMPAEKKPLNKKLIAILGGAMGLVMAVGITVLAITLGGRNSINTIPDDNDSYQQTSGVIFQPGEQNIPNTSTTSSESSTSASSSSSVATSTSTSTSTPGTSSGTPVSSPSSGTSDKPSAVSTTTTTTSSKVSDPKPASSGGTSAPSGVNPPAPSQTEVPSQVTIGGESFSTDQTRLSLSEMGLTDNDLDVLKYFKDLTILYLNSNDISDLSFVASLPKLEVLTVSDTKVTDLTALAGHRTLRTLTAKNCQIKDISPLSSCSNLQALWLDSSPVKDISPLKSCTLLRSLSLAFCDIEDLSPILDHKLKYLDVGSETVGNSKVLLNTLKQVHMTEGGTILTEHITFDSRADMEAFAKHIAANSNIKELTLFANYYTSLGKSVLGSIKLS